MKKYLIAVLVVFSLFVLACQNTNMLPPFPAAPIGQATVEQTGLVITPDTTTYSPGQQITVTLSPTDSTVYAVYRPIYFEPACATPPCQGNFLTDKVSNEFPKMTASYTAITSTYPAVTGSFKIPSDAVGQVTFALGTYKLVNGQWSTDNYYFYKKIIVTGSTYCQTNDDVRCNVNIEKCVNYVWRINQKCNLGCSSDSSNVWCKECATPTNTWCVGSTITQCSAAFKNTTSTICAPKPCNNVNVTTAKCGDCINGYKQCKNDDITLQTCTKGAWVNTVCPFVCNNVNATSAKCVGAPASP